MTNLLDWLYPFRIARSTYDTHLRVRLWWLGRWLLGGTFAACLGFVIATGAVAYILMGPRTKEAQVIGMYQVYLCRTHGLCSEQSRGTAIISIGMVAVSVGTLIRYIYPGAGYRPPKITDEEIEELRALGYLIFETPEEMLDVVNELYPNRCGDCRYRPDCLGPGELDQAGAVAGDQERRVYGQAEVY